MLLHVQDGHQGQPGPCGVGSGSWWMRMGFGSRKLVTYLWVLGTWGTIKS